MSEQATAFEGVDDMAHLAEDEHMRTQVRFQFIEDYHLAGVLNDVFVGRVSYSIDLGTAR